MSDPGCIILNFLRFAIGNEVERVEGCTILDEERRRKRTAPPTVESAISGGCVYEARRDVLEIGAHKLALFGEQGVLWTTGGAGTMS